MGKSKHSCVKPMIPMPKYIYIFERLTTIVHQTHNKSSWQCHAQTSKWDLNLHLVNHNLRPLPFDHTSCDDINCYNTHNFWILCIITLLHN
jgi:hypothetical protein